MPDATIIAQTANWISTVVIGCNFCPFAARVVNKKSVRYQVLNDATVKTCLETLVREMHLLDENGEMETTFIILPNSFADFYGYLDLVDKAERLLAKEGYDGVYQLASFHPAYCFAGALPNDAANFTNRSIFPMLHILREASITKALEGFAEPGNIPDRNIAFAQQKGFNYMKLLWESCKTV